MVSIRDRIKRLEKKAGKRVPLYPFVPALYIMVSIMIGIDTGMERPIESGPQPPF